MKKVKSLQALKALIHGKTVTYVPSLSSPYSMYANELTLKGLRKGKNESYNEAFVRFISQQKYWGNKELGETIAWYIE